MPLAFRPFFIVLSVRLFLNDGEAKPRALTLNGHSAGKPEAFRTEGGRAAEKPPSTSFTSFGARSCRSSDCVAKDAIHEITRTYTKLH